MQISIPSSVTKISKNAFYGCTSLTDITLPSSINASELNIPKNVQVKSGNNCHIYWKINTDITYIGKNDQFCINLK